MGSRAANIFIKSQSVKARRRRPVGGMMLAVSLLVVLTLLLPSLAGIFLQDERPHELATGVFGDRIVICTGSGLKVIKLDETGKPASDDEQQTDLATGLCAPLATSSLANFHDDVAAYLRQPLPPVFAKLLDHARPATAGDHPPILSRAPPLTV